MVNVTSRPFYPREKDSVPVTQEAGWALVSVWTGVEYLACAVVRSPDRPTRTIKLHVSYRVLKLYIVLYHTFIIW